MLSPSEHRDNASNGTRSLPGETIFSHPVFVLPLSWRRVTLRKGKRERYPRLTKRQTRDEIMRSPRQAKRINHTSCGPKLSDLPQCPNFQPGKYPCREPIRAYRQPPKKKPKPPVTKRGGDGRNPSASGTRRCEFKPDRRLTSVEFDFPAQPQSLQPPRDSYPPR